MRAVGPNTGTGGRRARRGGTVLVVALLAVGTLAGAGQPGWAAPSRDGASGGPGEAVAGDSRPKAAKNLTELGGESVDSHGARRSGRQAAAERTAARRARTSKRSVVVDALTTETQRVTVNPEGVFTLSQTLLPTRTRRGGAWVDVDTRLRRNPDGSFSPAATAYGQVRISGGGTGPLASSTSPRGSLALAWPGRLPAPRVTGDTATYPEVMPGVDLVVTATVSGGFSEVLVVKDAEAAANPELRRLSLTTSVSRGLRVSAGSGGSLAVLDSRRREAFTAPAPLMWDNTSPAQAAAGRTGTTTATTASSTTTSRAASATATSARPGASAGPRPDPSSVHGPGAGARIGRVRATVSGSRLSLVPDADLLTNPTTRFPVYIDPTWNPHPAGAGTNHFTEVKQGSPCTNTSLYDNTGDAGDYGRLAVGYQGWPGGCNGVMRAYYELGIPSTIWNTHILGAQINITEVYASVCSNTSNAELYWTGSIGPGTTWNNQPGWISYLGQASFPPACNGNVSRGYDVTGLIGQASDGSWNNVTVGLANDSSERYSDRNQFKRFSNNPSLQVQYNSWPWYATTAGTKIIVGTSTIPCTAGAPYPYVGKTVLTTPPTLSASVKDSDGDLIEDTFEYWVEGSGGTTSATGSTVSSGQYSTYTLPAGFVTGLADGATVAWRARTFDGMDWGDWSPTCRFTVLKTAPEAPTIASVDDVFPDTDAGGGTGAAAGTAAQFTLTSTESRAASFVYRLDNQPASSNPPSSQVVTASSGRATVTITPPGPGPHTLWVYARDAARNSSGLAAYRFTAAGHPKRTFAGLAEAFDNVAITDDEAPEAGGADGYWSYSAQELRSAGWTPGGEVTVNGATFTVPDFGTGKPDNVLAAGQTITLPPGSRGNALVFLVSATNGYTKAPSSGETVTSPAIPADWPIVKGYCLATATACLPHGTISYASDSGATPQSYDLTAPDWVTGPRSLAAVALTRRNVADGTQESNPARIYTFAVPLQPGAEVTSVTLPDVGDTARGFPALHVFGMAVRDTTTAPGGRTWTGAWSGPFDNTYYQDSNDPHTPWGDQTFRNVITPSVSGSTARIKLSNARGDVPLAISHATVATRSTGAAPTAAPVDLTFDGQREVTIPTGAEVFSDPVDVPVTAGQRLLVSLHLTGSADAVGRHTWSTDGYSYTTAPGTGDLTAAVDPAAFTAEGSTSGYWTSLVTGLQVVTDGLPTVAVLGEGLVDTATSTATPTWGFANPRVADLLAGQGSYGVVKAGNRRNRIGYDGYFSGADAALDREVLSQPGIGTVVLTGGLQDLLDGTSATELQTQTLEPIIDRLQAWGINVVLGDLTPCRGYAACTPEIDAARRVVNGWISDRESFLPPSITPVGFAQAVSVDDPAGTATPPDQVLGTEYDTGDHVNLTKAGFAALAGTIPIPALAANVPPSY
ncbi:MAG: hypothetical protein GXX79_00510 [Actinomycetales bacterium]|nr:hypothetical protein [Actinomycetales bacterium]